MYDNLDHRHADGPFAAADQVDGGVVTDAEEPALEVSLLLVIRERLEGLPQGVLKRIFAVLLVSEHLPEISIKAVFVAGEQLPCRSQVRIAEIALDELLLGVHETGFWALKRGDPGFIAGK